MMETKPDTPELDNNEVERRQRKRRSVEGGGSGNLIRRPTRKQLERSIIGTYQAVGNELRRKVKFRLGNKTEELSVIEAILRQLSNAALRGDLRAQRELLAQYRAERSIVTKSGNPGYDLDLLSYDDLQE